MLRSFFPRADLTGMMIQRATKIEDFGAVALFPFLDVKVISDQFAKLAKGRAHRKYATLKRPGSAASRSFGELESDNFTCKQHMHDEEIDNGEAAIIAAQVDYRRIAAENVLFILMRDLNAEILGQIINNTNFPLSGNTGATVGAAWNSAGGTPHTDINTALEAFRARGAPKPDTLLIGEKAFDNLALNPEIIDRISAVSDMVVNPRFDEITMAKALGLKRVVVDRSRVNTAPDGSTVVLSPQLGVGDAFLAVTSQAPTFLDWQLGRTAMWDGKTGGRFAFGMYGENAIDADLVRGEAWWVAKLLSADCGYRFAGVAA